MGLVLKCVQSRGTGARKYNSTEANVEDAFALFQPTVGRAASCGPSDDPSVQSKRRRWIGIIAPSGSPESSIKPLQQTESLASETHAERH